MRPNRPYMECLGLSLFVTKLMFDTQLLGFAAGDGRMSKPTNQKVSGSMVVRTPRGKRTPGVNSQGLPAETGVI